MKKLLCLLLMLALALGATAAFADGLSGELTIASRDTCVQG